MERAKRRGKHLQMETDGDRDILITDAIISGTSCKMIRQQALQEKWKLQDILDNAAEIEASIEQYEPEAAAADVNKIAAKRYSNKYQGPGRTSGSSAPPPSSAQKNRQKSR